MEWLNDQVYPFLSELVDGHSAHHSLFRSYPSEHAPGLRVFVPTTEYLLAMKLMAMRIHDADKAAGRDPARSAALSHAGSRANSA